jgi:RNA polymerase sigma factor (sigma-70 family)
MLTDVNDQALMAAYSRGDETAFELIYARYSPKVMGYLGRKLRTPEERDEVFQLVFLKFHRSRHSYDPSYPLLQWLYVISKSVYLDYLKQARVRNRVLTEVKVQDLIERVEPREMNTLTTDEAAHEFLKDLEGVQKEVARQRFMEDASFEEIAQTLDLSPSNVRQILSRAIKKLRSLPKFSREAGKIK